MPLVFGYFDFSVDHAINHFWDIWVAGEAIFTLMCLQIMTGYLGCFISLLYPHSSIWRRILLTFSPTIIGFIYFGLMIVHEFVHFILYNAAPAWIVTIVLWLIFIICCLCGADGRNEEYTYFFHRVYEQMREMYRAMWSQRGIDPDSVRVHYTARNAEEPTMEQPDDEVDTNVNTSDVHTENGERVLHSHQTEDDSTNTTNGVEIRDLNTSPLVPKGGLRGGSEQFSTLSDDGTTEPLSYTDDEINEVMDQPVNIPNVNLDDFMPEDMHFSEDSADTTDAVHQLDNTIMSIALNKYNQTAGEVVLSPYVLEKLEFIDTHYYFTKLTYLEESQKSTFLRVLTYPDLYKDASDIQLSYAYDFYQHHYEFMDHSNLECWMYLYSHRPFKTPFYNPAAIDIALSVNIVARTFLRHWKMISIIAAGICAWFWLPSIVLSIIIGGYTWWKSGSAPDVVETIHYKRYRDAIAVVRSICDSCFVRIKDGCRLQFISIEDYILVNDGRCMWIGYGSGRSVPDWLCKHQHAVGHSSSSETNLNEHLLHIDLRDPNYYNNVMKYWTMSYSTAVVPGLTDSLLICTEMQQYLSSIVHKMRSYEELESAAHAIVTSMNHIPGRFMNQIVKNTATVVWHEKADEFEGFVRSEVQRHGNRMRKVATHNLTKYYAGHIFNQFDVENHRLSIIVANIFSLCSMISLNFGKKDF